MTTATGVCLQTRSLDDRQERLDTWTHALGLALAIAGSVVLLREVCYTCDQRTVGAVAVFAITLCLTYLASTLFHAAHGSPMRRALQTLDHISIYLLIAGTWTPFLLFGLEPGTLEPALAIVWTVALGGSFLRYRLRRRFHKISIGLYLSMGSGAVLTLWPLAATLSDRTVSLFLLGAMAYLLGAAFYFWHRLPYNHAVWHVWTIVGSTLHFFALRSALPLG